LSLAAKKLAWPQLQIPQWQVGDLIAEIARRGVAIVLVEQKLLIAMRLSPRVYVMGHGQSYSKGTPSALMNHESIRNENASAVRPPSCIDSMVCRDTNFAIGDRELVHEKRLNDCHSVTALFAIPEYAHVLLAFPLRDRIPRIGIILIPKEPLTL
jgi:ABC-type multidrug transport system ATPase subunit